MIFKVCVPVSASTYTVSGCHGVVDNLLSFMSLSVGSCSQPRRNFIRMLFQHLPISDHVLVNILLDSGHSKVIVDFTIGDKSWRIGDA